MSTCTALCLDLPSLSKLRAAVQLRQSCESALGNAESNSNIEQACCNALASVEEGGEGGWAELGALRRELKLGMNCEGLGQVREGPHQKVPG